MKSVVHLAVVLLVLALHLSTTRVASGLHIAPLQPAYEGVALAYAGGHPAQASNRLSLAALTFEPSDVSGGNPATGTVELDAAAPDGGVMVELSSSDPSVASMPGTAVVAKGNSSVTFPVSTYPVSRFTVVTMTASYGGASVETLFSIIPLELFYIQVEPDRVAGTGPATVYVYLTDVVGADGVEVALESSNPAVAQAPDAVVFPQGNSWAAFTIPTADVSEPTAVSVTATMGAISSTYDFTIVPSASVNLLYFGTENPGEEGGSTFPGTVVLDGGAPGAGALVTLESSHPEVASVPESVLIPAGATSVWFDIDTTPVAEWTEVVFSASYQDVTVTTDLTVMSPLEDFDLEADEAEAGELVSGHVTLSLAAPEGDAEVALLSSDPAVASVQESVVIPAGERFATFAIVTHDVAMTTPVEIRATYREHTRIASLTISPQLAGPTAVAMTRLDARATTQGWAWPMVMAGLLVLGGYLRHRQR